MLLREAFSVAIVSKSIYFSHLLAPFPAAFQQRERHAGAHQASHRPQGIRGGPGDGHPPSGDELPLQLRAAAHHYRRTVRILISAAPAGVLLIWMAEHSSITQLHQHDILYMFYTTHIQL